jgi:hypothetical protein
MGNGTARGLVEYLDNLVDRGKGSLGAISPLKIAFTKVLKTVDGNDWQAVEVRTIDVEDYMHRFANLTLGKYSPETLSIYKTRVGKVVNWYVQFLDTPGWAPSIQRRAPRQPKKAAAVAASAPVAQSQAGISPAAQGQQAPAQPAPAPTNPPDFITYPYPLSNGQLIQISLPVKLSRSDAKRIAAFIESIAVDN